MGEHPHEFDVDHEHDIFDGSTMEVVEPAMGAHLSNGDLTVGCLEGHTVTIDGTTLHLHDADGDDVPEYIAERPY